jgi:hypothetical protein
MALKGNLRDFSTTQLLNLINLARKTGTLTLDTQTGGAQLAFRDGKLISVKVGNDCPSLALVLLKAGKLTENQAKALQARAPQIADRELAQMLVNAGYVSQSDILQSSRQYVLDLVYRLFGWDDGAFHFEANQLLNQNLLVAPIELESIILEGSRRVRELEQLQQELPDLDKALKFIDRPDARLRNVNLSVDEWKVVSFITPKNTIRQIARANNMDEIKIRRIIYGLLQAGLVQIVSVAGTVSQQLPKENLSSQSRSEKKSLINRLITRIRSL